MWFLVACNGSSAVDPLSPGGAAGTIPALPEGPPPERAFPFAEPTKGAWPSGEGSCPADMVRVPGRRGPFCIHAYEASFSGKPGRTDQGAGWPDGSTQGTVTAAAGQAPAAWFTWYQAAAACKQAGFHLCTSQEWQDACAGPAARQYATPDGTYAPGVCGIGTQVGGDANAAPRPTGSWPNCHTPEGVYDLLGSVWEWTDPGGSSGVPTTDMRGGAAYSMEASVCTFQAVGAQPPTFQGAIGFRCCAPVTP